MEEKFCAQGVLGFRKEKEMAETSKLVSFGDLPSHLILEVLTSGCLSVIDLVNIELTSKVFGWNQNGLYSSNFKSLADYAASRLCSLHPIFMGLGLNTQKELVLRCKGNWKRVLRFLQFVVESWGMVKTSKGNMQITTGTNLTMVIRNSKVYSCGSNVYGALDHGPENVQCLGLTPIDLPFSAKVIQVSASDYNAAFVMQSGEVYTCGKNYLFGCGQLDTNLPIDRPKLVEALKETPCKQVSTGVYSTVFLTREGQVYTVGGNTHGQLGHGDTMNRQVPKMVELLKNIVQISAGPCYVLAVTEDGSVYSFGNGSDLCLGDDDLRDKLRPHAIEAFKSKGVHILRVSAGDAHAVAVDSNGYVYTWGRGDSGALGHDDNFDKPIPEVLLSLENQLAVQVCASFMKTSVVVESGLVYGFGFGWLGFSSPGVNKVVIQPRTLEGHRPQRVLQVSTASFHMVVVTQEGRLLKFGNNRDSQLGHHSMQQPWLQTTEIFLNP